MKPEQTNNYVKETIPVKKYRYILRERRGNEIYLSDILIALFIVLMMLTLFINYLSNLSSAPVNQTSEKEVDVNINIKNNLSCGPVLILPKDAVPVL